MLGSARPWSSLDAARAHDAASRLPFVIDDAVVGSVARAHLEALAAHAHLLRTEPRALHLNAPAGERDAAFRTLNDALRRAGLIIGWRDEIYPLVDPQSMRLLARLERAASRFWGTLTFGTHCNGYVADASGRPAHLWIARRSLTKATDPGKLDNLVGGGVPHGQTPLQTLLREGWEEAGLRPAQMQGAVAGRGIRLLRDIPEGLQHEWLYVFDLALPPGLRPSNQDGEVAEWHLLPIDEALARAAGDEMTVDASLVTLDFALRHGLLPHDEARRLAERAHGVLIDTLAAPPLE
jgi:8-oxo-dGTP pyrophosphatase MutT (NUDIX family)